MPVQAGICVRIEVEGHGTPRHRRRQAGISVPPAGLTSIHPGGVHPVVGCAKSPIPTVARQEASPAGRVVPGHGTGRDPVVRAAGDCTYPFRSWGLNRFWRWRSVMRPGIDRQGAETGTRSVCPRRNPGRERVRRLLGQAFCISGSCTEVVVLMPSRLREVADSRSGAPSRRAVRRAQTFF